MWFLKQIESIILVEKELQQSNIQSISSDLMLKPR